MKRGRNQRRRQGSNINRAFDSNGPDVRIRGTANQIFDKYQNLARDAASAGDRVKAENYLQHAEHYFRLIKAMQPPSNNQPAANGHAEAGNGDQPDPDQNENNAASEQNQKTVDTDDSNSRSEAEEGEAKQSRPRARRRRPRQDENADDGKNAGETGEVAAKSGDGETGTEPSAGDDAPKKPARRTRRKKAVDAEEVETV